MKVVSLFFLSLNIYRALLLRIEPVLRKIETQTSYIYIYIYIYIYFHFFNFFNFLLFDILARVGNLAINVNPFLSFSGIN